MKQQSIKIIDLQRNEQFYSRNEGKIVQRALT